VESDGAATGKLLITVAKQLAKIWQANSPAEHREFLSAVVARVVVHDTSRDITLVHRGSLPEILKDILWGVSP
jgi:hypothetical protein